MYNIDYTQFEHSVSNEQRYEYIGYYLGDLARQQQRLIAGWEEDPMFRWAVAQAVSATLATAPHHPTTLATALQQATGLFRGLIQQVSSGSPLQGPARALWATGPVGWFVFNLEHLEGNNRLQELVLYDMLYAGRDTLFGAKELQGKPYEESDAKRITFIHNNGYNRLYRRS